MALPKRNRKSKGSLRLGALSLLVIGSIILSFTVFSNTMYRLTTESVEQRLSENAENNARSLEAIFTNDRSTLTAMAEGIVMKGKNLPADEILSDPEVISYMRMVAGYTNFIRMGMDLPDGTSYTSDGYTVSVSDMGYLPGVLEGSAVLTGIHIAKVDSLPSIGMVVPIKAEGKVIGALRGTYRQEILKRYVDISVFEGEGFFGILDKDGKVLASHTADGYIFRNLREDVEEGQFAEGYTREKLLSDLSSGGGGYTKFNLDGTEYWGYYTPLGIDDWYVITMAPSGYVLEEKHRMDRAAMALVFFLSVVFLVLLAYLLLESRKARKGVEAHRDYLETILDSIPLPVFITDNDRLLDYVNKAALQLFGKTRKDVLGHPCSSWGISICGTKECSIERMKRMGECVNDFSMEGRRYVVTGAELCNREMEKMGFLEIINDISELMEARQDLEDASIELATISQYLDGGLLITELDESFTIIRGNTGYCELVGLSEEEEASVKGMKALDFVDSEDRVNLREYIYASLEKSDNVFCEYRLMSRRGRVWVSLRGKRAVLRGKAVGVWLLTDINDIKAAQLELQVSEERYRLATQNTSDIIVDYDIQNRVLVHEERAVELYGVLSRMENVPESLLESGLVLPRYHEAVRRMFEELAEGKAFSRCELRVNSVEGRVIWQRMSFTSIYDEDGLPVRAVGLLEDITSEREAQREALYRGMAMGNAILSYEANLTQKVFVTGHEKLKAAYGITTDDIDSIVRLLCKSMVYIEDQALVYSHINVCNLLEQFGKGRDRIEFDYRRVLGKESESGGPFWVRCSIYIFLDEDTGECRIICNIRDIHESKVREINLKRQAELDLLTGVYNKVTTENKVKDFLKGGNCKGAFLLIDLDNFKRINDQLGHAFGDSVLTEIAQKIKAILSPRDIVGRLGGDEFLVFLTAPESKEHIIEQATLLCGLFHNAFTGKDKDYKVSGTIGISVSPENGTGFNELYRKADEALYCAKRRGKDTFMFYDSAVAGSCNGCSETLQEGEFLGENSGIKEDEGSEEGMLSASLTEKVMDVLYESGETSQSINGILELVCKEFGFDRGYIFTRGGKSGHRHQWRNPFILAKEGMPPLMPPLEYPGAWFTSGILEDVDGHFEGKEVYVTNQETCKDSGWLEGMKTSGSKSLIHGAIRKDGEIKAFVGFDTTAEITSYSESIQASIRLISRLMGIFILADEEEAMDSFEPHPGTEIAWIMDHMDNYIYVIDQQTHELVFLNKRTRELLPGAGEGQLCHKALCGSDLPCKGCPMEGISSAGRHKCLFYNSFLKGWMEVSALEIVWQDGRHCCLMYCKDHEGEGLEQ